MNKEIYAHQLSLEKLIIEIDGLKLSLREEQTKSESYLKEWDTAVKKKDMEMEAFATTNQKRIFELQESLDQSDKKVLDLISGQKAINAHHQAQYETIKSQSILYKNKTDELENLGTISKAEISNLKIRLKESQDNERKLSELEKALKLEIANLQTKLNHGENQISKYTVTENKLREEIEDLKVKLEESRYSLDKTRVFIEEGESHRRTASELKTKLDTVKKGRMDTVKAMDHIKQELNQIINQKEEDCRNLEKVLQTLTEEHKKLQSDFESERKQMQELAENYKQREKDLNNSNNELALLKKKFKELNSENSQTLVTYNKTKIDFEKLTTTLIEENARHAKVERKYELENRELQ